MPSRPSPRSGPSSRTRRLAQVLLPVLLLLVARITLWPSPVDASGGPALREALELLHERGLPHWVDYSFVETAANVVMFVPYGALLALSLPVRRWWLAVAVPALTSVLVETLQLVALPRRSASEWDVVANTMGALVGVLVVVGVAAVVARHRTQRGSTTPCNVVQPPNPRSLGAG